MKRAEATALEIVEESETMEDAQDRLQDACDWDWAIYCGMAMELCCNVPFDVLNEAEDMVDDVGGVPKHHSLFDHASLVAYWIIWGSVSRCIQDMASKFDAPVSA